MSERPPGEGASPVGPRAPRRDEPPAGAQAGAPHRGWLVGLALLTAYGAWLRASGLTHLGWFRDDAWVALGARTGPRTALEMGATAPGFALALRSWLQAADPATTWWGQLPVLVVAIAATPAVYATCRTLRLGPAPSLAGAAVVAVSPVAVGWSVHLKPYPVDLLIACAVLVLVERIRVEGARRDLALLAGTSVLGFALSASVLPAIVGGWTALVASALWCRSGRGSALAWAGATAAALGGVYLVLFHRLSSWLTRTWHDYFVDLSSPGEALDTTLTAAGRLVGGVLGMSWVDHGALALALLVAMAVGAATTGRRSWAALASVGAAVAAAAAQRSPIGTGRIDEVIYPALIVTGLLAVQAGVEAVDRRWVRAAPSVKARAAAVAGVVVVLAALGLGASRSAHYRGTDLTAMAAEVAAVRQSGDVVVVDARTRYLWALTQQDELDVVFGDHWLTGFTVRSHDPAVRFEESYRAEGGYEPERWADQVSAADRILYVSTPFEDPTNPLDAPLDALEDEGWQEADRLDVEGGRLLVLARQPGG